MQFLFVWWNIIASNIQRNNYQFGLYQYQLEVNISWNQIYSYSFGINYDNWIKIIQFIGPVYYFNKIKIIIFKCPIWIFPLLKYNLRFVIQGKNIYSSKIWSLNIDIKFINQFSKLITTLKNVVFQYTTITILSVIWFQNSNLISFLCWEF